MNDTFEMQHQERTLWCWAAVAVSVHNFLDEGNETQADLAGKVLGGDCTQSNACDTGADLGLALKVVGNWKETRNTPLTFESIKQWIDAGLPICVKITWYDGSGHAIVIDGYREWGQTQLVHAQDPLYGPSWQLYDELVQDYPPGGSWQGTYLIKE